MKAEIRPFQCPTVGVVGKWHAPRPGRLVWHLDNGEEVSDADLRSWCARNLPYPSNTVVELQVLHVNAWAQHHKEYP